MSFIITGSGKRTAESNDGAVSDAPHLIITYSVSSSAGYFGSNDATHIGFIVPVISVIPCHF